MYLLELEVGLRLPMIKFVRNVLIFHKVTPLSYQRWHGVLFLGLAFCNFYSPEACHLRFSASYLLRKTTLGARYFILQSWVEKIIINMVDNDCDMRDTVVRMFGPWDVDSEKERGAVLVV